MPKHGEYITEGQWQNSRWCEVHKSYHGLLYQCEHFPPELLDELKDDYARLVENLTDPEWVKKQLANGTPPEAIAIMKIFAGL